MRVWGQSRGAAAQRHLGLSVRRWAPLRRGHDGAGGRGHPALPLSGGVCGDTAAGAPAAHGERPTRRVARPHLLPGPREHLSGVFGGHLTMFVAADGVLYGTFTAGLTAARSTTSAGGTSRQTGSFAARGTCGTAGGNAAPRCTSRARSWTGDETFAFSPKDRLGTGCTDACPATRRAIELFRCRDGNF